MAGAGSTMQQGGYDHLEAEPVRRTAVRLGERIQARHADRNLVRVAGELVSIIDEVARGSIQISARLRIARIASTVLVLALIAGAVVLFTFSLRDLTGENAVDRSFDWLALAETMVNDVVFVVIAVFFLVSVPDRIQRGQTLAMLHKLRSLAHVIDMHQLDKDPERLKAGFQPTEATLPVNLSRSQMESYLDYCSELLSIVGKAAALCADGSHDAVVLDTVNSIETLTNGMSRKIWQKISVLPPA